MKIIVVRLDLDRLNLDVVERLLADEIITPEEATESRVVKMMKDWHRVMWMRSVMNS